MKRQVPIEKTSLDWQGKSGLKRQVQIEKASPDWKGKSRYLYIICEKWQGKIDKINCKCRLKRDWPNGLSRKSVEKFIWVSRESRVQNVRFMLSICLEKDIKNTVFENQSQKVWFFNTFIVNWNIFEFSRQKSILEFF